MERTLDVTTYVPLSIVIVVYAFKQDTHKTIFQRKIAEMVRLAFWIFFKWYDNLDDVLEHI